MSRDSSKLNVRWHWSISKSTLPVLPWVASDPAGPGLNVFGRLCPRGEPNAGRISARHGSDLRVQPDPKSRMSIDDTESGRDSLSPSLVQVACRACPPPTGRGWRKSDDQMCSTNANLGKIRSTFLRWECLWNNLHPKYMFRPTAFPLWEGAAQLSNR
jgi:hypothetical protein